MATQRKSADHEKRFIEAWIAAADMIKNKATVLGFLRISEVPTGVLRDEIIGDALCEAFPYTWG